MSPMCCVVGLLVCLAVVVSHAGLAEGATCYVCDSVSEDTCNEDDFSPWGKSTRSGCQYCTKTVGKVGIKLVQRGCADICLNVDADYGIIGATVKCCSSLLCNSSVLPRATAASTVGLLVLTYLIM